MIISQNGASQFERIILCQFFTIISRVAYIDVTDQFWHMESTPNEVNKLGVTRHFHSKDVIFCTCILRHIEVDLKMFLAEEIVPLHEESLTPEHLWQRFWNSYIVSDSVNLFRLTELRRIKDGTHQGTCGRGIYRQQTRPCAVLKGHCRDSSFFVLWALSDPMFVFRCHYPKR